MIEKSAGRVEQQGFPLDQMYLSTHPHCGFGWIDGHVTSRKQGLCQRIREAEKRDPGNEVVSEEDVIICISKANDDRAKSFLYVCKLEDNHIGEGNPVYLINPRSGMNLWGNTDLRREKPVSRDL